MAAHLNGQDDVTRQHALGDEPALALEVLELCLGQYHLTARNGDFLSLARLR